MNIFDKHGNEITIGCKVSFPVGNYSDTGYVNMIVDRETIRVNSLSGERRLNGKDVVRIL